MLAEPDLLDLEARRARARLEAAIRRVRDASLDVETQEGCDCTELCEMGTTCPGGGLADLPGSGCWRTAPAVSADTAPQDPS